MKSIDAFTRWLIPSFIRIKSLQFNLSIISPKKANVLILSSVSVYLPGIFLSGALLENSFNSARACYETYWHGSFNCWSNKVLQPPTITPIAVRMNFLYDPLDFIRGETMKFSSTDHKRPKKIEISRPRRFVKYLSFGKIRGYANFSVLWFDGTTSEKESLGSYLDTVTLESGFKHSNQFHVTCFPSRVPITKLFIDCFLFISLLRGRGRIIDARKGTGGDARRCLPLVYETWLDFPARQARPSFCNYYSIDEGGPFYDRYRSTMYTCLYTYVYTCRPSYLLFIRLSWLGVRRVCTRGVERT